MALPDQALPRFRDLFDEARATTKALRIPTDPRHLAIVSLHCSVLDQARGLITLLESSNATCSFIVLRSLLEAVVDLFNLCADPQYEKVMRCNSLKERRTILTNATTPAARTNPYFQDFTSRPQLTGDMLKAVSTELQHYAVQGVTPLKIYQRFQRANRIDLYQVPYAYLCWHFHHDINVVEAHHGRQAPDGGAAVAYFPAPSDDDVLLILDTAGGLIAEAVASLHKVAGADPAQLDGITQKLSALRELWKAHTPTPLPASV